MYLDTLILELGDCTMSILPNTNLKTDFAQIQMLSAPRGGFFPQALYFGRWTEFEALSELPHATVVIYDDRMHRDANDLNWLETFTGGLIFSDQADYERCYLCFEECFLSAYRTDHLLDEISDTVYNTENLQTLANRIANLFDHPINIVDNSFTVLASSNNYEFFSEDLARDNVSGFIPPEIIKRLNIASRRRHNSQNKTIVIDHIHGQFQNYFTPVVFNDIVLGYFSVFLPPKTEMSPLLRSYLPKVAVLVGAYMQRADVSIASRSNYYTTLLSSLLSENPQLNAIEEDRFQTFGYRMREYKYIYVVDITQDNPEAHVASELGKAFKKIFGNCIYTTQQNQIIYLASYDSPSEHLDAIIEQCENQMLSTPFVHVGIGSPFTVLSEARGHFLEARAAIETGIMFHPYEHVFVYDDYRLMHMVQTLGHHTDMRMFSLPQLRMLRDYDHKHNAELLFTLYTHSKYVGNVSKICEVLHVHRNTLYFRLGKIQELTHLNLESSDQLAMILISFTIMKLQNEIFWD